jgi:hypothetical protein
MSCFVVYTLRVIDYIEHDTDGVCGTNGKHEESV